MTEKTILVYRTSEGNEPFTQWLFSLKDKIIRQRIETRIERIKHGNYGDHKRFLGILEIQLDFSKGYRIYCGEKGNTIVILLVGGDKSSQDIDIQTALEYWRDYHA